MSTRTLLILRHAKAANPEGVPDLDRPLTDRGHADAGALGAWLARTGRVPDLVLCSPSRRTRETWHAIAQALPRVAVSYRDEVYAASATELLDLVASVADEVATVALVGHNPGLSLLSRLLDPVNADPDGLRTAGAAVHSWTGAWADSVPGAAPLVEAHTARGDES